MDRRPLPSDADATAPDGSQVRLGCIGRRGSMAHFRLGAGLTSRAVTHRTSVGGCHQDTG